MRAIIIEDKDARGLLESLKLEKFQPFDAFGRTALRTLTESERKQIIQEIHGNFHYVVCRWLQDQGADVVRKG